MRSRYVNRNFYNVLCDYLRLIARIAPARWCAAMDKPRPCGCKGIRTCLICESNFGLTKEEFSIREKTETYVFCPWCEKAWSGWSNSCFTEHPNHQGESAVFPGIYIQLNFITPEEEQKLLKGIEEVKWDLSQSGRRKQNFGPRCNFKKQRLKIGDFKGFPLFTKFVQDKFKDVPILEGFRTVEQCTLEYDPSRGASIDPHIDDCWVWGERVVTVNLLSDCVLTMTRYTGDDKKYNLKCVPGYPSILDKNGSVIYNPFMCVNSGGSSYPSNSKLAKDSFKETVPVFRIPMPARSLLVIYGSARYDWEHRVLRDDVTNRRICLAYREFTPPYLPGGAHADVGGDILSNSEYFWDHLSIPSYS